MRINKIGSRPKLVPQPTSLLWSSISRTCSKMSGSKMPRQSGFRNNWLITMSFRVYIFCWDKWLPCRLKIMASSILLKSQQSEFRTLELGGMSKSTSILWHCTRWGCLGLLRAGTWGTWPGAPQCGCCWNSSGWSCSAGASAASRQNLLRLAPRSN